MNTLLLKQFKALVFVGLWFHVNFSAWKLLAKAILSYSKKNTNSAWALNENMSHIRNGRNHFAGLGRSWQWDKSGHQLPVAIFLTLPVSSGWSICSPLLLSLSILVLSFFVHPSVLSYILPPDLVTFKSFVMSCGGAGKAKHDALLIPAMELWSC